VTRPGVLRLTTSPPAKADRPIQFTSGGATIVLTLTKAKVIDDPAAVRSSSQRSTLDRPQATQAREPVNRLDVAALNNHTSTVTRGG
jgi:hypothetical protein